MKTSNAKLIVILLIVISGCSESESKVVSDDNPFWNDGIPFFDMQEVTPSSVRSSQILVAMDGSILAFFGSQFRRSTDGGKTWGKPINLDERVRSLVIDESSEDIIFFGGDGHDWSGHWFRSRDNGKTWNLEGKIADIENRIETLEVDEIPIFNQWPVDLDLYLRNYGGGSENGIMLRYGDYKGRLLVPMRVQYRLKKEDGSYDSMSGKLDLNVVIYSDDGGKSWKQSDPVFPFGNDEAAIAEISDGKVYHNSRNNIHLGNKHISWSYDGGKTWKDHYIDEFLPDGPHSGRLVSKGHYGMKAGLVRLPLDDHDILIFSNVDSEEDRKNLTVWASFDGGKTWPVKRLVDNGPSGYSGLAAGRAGTVSAGLIYIKYEDTQALSRVARFNLAWLTNGVDWKEYIN